MHTIKLYLSIFLHIHNPNNSLQILLELQRVVITSVYTYCKVTNTTPIEGKPKYLFLIDGGYLYTSISNTN